MKKPLKLSKSKREKRLKQRRAKQELWRKGVLRWKLHDIQKIIYDIYWNGEDDISTMLISRQLGKSFVLAVIATEICLRKKNAVVKFVTPKLKQVKNILNKNMKTILEDCPVDVRPEWKENDKVWRFPNGSEIQAAGTDNQNYDNIRGGTCDGWMVDEAGFCSDLEEVIYNVLIPTTTMTGGRGILSSTPDPKQPEHDFITIFVSMALEQGKLHKYTIDDNPRLTRDEIIRIENRYVGGRKNTSFRAEYLCEILRDEDSMVVPEFDDMAEADIVISSYNRPTYRDAYVAMDIGGKDFTVILFGYYDFLRHKVVIEDELVFRERQNTLSIANAVRSKIDDLWNGKPAYQMRADNNNVLFLNDLRQDHGLNFLPTRKDNKEAQIQRLRLQVQMREIEIHEKCKTLIYHLKTATWAKTTKANFKQFARSKDQGHFDAVDALVYFLRNVIYRKNPFPNDYGMMGEDNAYVGPKPKGKYSEIFDIFKVKKYKKDE